VGSGEKNRRSVFGSEKITVVVCVAGSYSIALAPRRPERPNVMTPPEMLGEYSVFGVLIPAGISSASPVERSTIAISGLPLPLARDS
jgi:hypothetical protein